MTRFLLLLLLALAAGAAAAFYLRAESGYVLLSFGPWVLETSVLGFALAAVLLLLAVNYGGRLLVAIVRLPATVRGALQERRERRAQQSFEAGLQRLLQGEWQRAEIELVRRAADHHVPALNYLLAARAAQWSGAHDRSRRYLELAAAQGESTALTVSLVRAELQMEQQAYADAIACLKKLQAEHPKHPYVLERLAQAYARKGEWEPLRQLLTSREARRLMAPERHGRWLARSLCELLDQAAANARLDAAKALWGAAPGPMRSTPEVRRAYVRALARVGAEAEAAAQIVSVLKQDWDGDLVGRYGTLDGVEAVTQLATVESWLTQYGEKPELLLTAGRVCLRNQLWGKARTYLEATLRSAPSPAVCLELARLCEATRNADEAQKFYRQGLELAARA